jgi:sugar lactone lactonase YvrE/streptogramin lyase
MSLMWHAAVADSVRAMIGRRGSWFRSGAALIAAVAGLAAAAHAASAQEPVTAFGDEPGALRLPEAVAVAPDGDVLVGDHFSGRVMRFREGAYVSSFGLKGEGCGRLGAIGGLAADPQGNTYVLDTDQQLVQVFDARGASVRCFGGRGSGAGKLYTTSGSYAASSASGGIAVTKDAIYVADANNNRVQRFTLTGKNPKILGKGKLKLPQGLAVKGKRLLVADDGNHRVVELTTSGRFVKATSVQTGVRLRFPYDVAFDAHGGAYVADNNLHRIVQLDRHLKRVRAWGTQGHGHGRFVYPRAVAVQRDGHLLVADAGNDRVQEFTATGGYVRTIGRNGRATPHVTQPADVAANALGEVAVADGNGRISWFSLTGAFAGSWAQSKSFQNSTAVVAKPDALDFASDRSLRVVDGGDVREYADRIVHPVLVAGQRGPFATSVDVGADGGAWALQPSGQFARVPDAPGAPPQWVGPKDDPIRNSTAIARLTDGTIAVAEGTSPHQTRPRDGTVGRYDQTGRLLATWPVPRPAGGSAQPSRPSGVAATADGGAWVADAANDRLLRLTADGAIAQTLGAPGSGDGQLAEPRGLELDCAGGLLVADSGNNRIVRFPGIDPAPAGCAPAGAPTAHGRPPAPVGLHLKTKERAEDPGARIATATATCRRTCRLEVTTARIGVIAKGAIQGFPATTTIRGSTIVVKASAKAVAAMRAAQRKGGMVTAGIEIAATASDGVIDRAGLSWSFS